jgi:hypothetical protein
MRTVGAREQHRFFVLTDPPTLRSGSKKRGRRAWLPLQPQGLREEPLIEYNFYVL